MKIHLGKKCLKNKSPEFVYALGARSISVNDLKCGVRNITNEHSISASDICWSKTEEKLGKFIQSLFTVLDEMILQRNALKKYLYWNNMKSENPCWFCLTKIWQP